MREIPGEIVPEAPAPPPRRRGWLVAAALVVGILVMTLGYSWFSGSRGVALALSFTEGASSSYRMTMSVKGELQAAGQSIPYDLTMNGMVELRVVSVQNDGVAEVQEVFSDVSMTSDGKPVDLPADLPSPVLHITTDGRVVSSTGATLFGGGGTQGPTQIGQDGISAVLPTEAVRTGDAWRTPVTQTILGTAVTYTAQGRYVRDEELDGVRAAVVHTVAVVPIDLTVRATDVAELMGLPVDQVPSDASFTYAGQEHVRRTSWIDAEASALLRTTSQGDYRMTMSSAGLPAGSLPPGGLSMDGTVTMTLQRS